MFFPALRCMLLSFDLILNIYEMKHSTVYKNSTEAKQFCGRYSNYRKKQLLSDGTFSKATRVEWADDEAMRLLP